MTNKKELDIDSLKDSFKKEINSVSDNLFDQVPLDLEEPVFTATDYKSLVSLLKANNTLLLTFQNNNVVKYNSTKFNEVGTTIKAVEEADIHFEIDIESGFSSSDELISDKLLSIAAIFPNAARTKLSEEMISFYCTFVTSVALGDVYFERFKEVYVKYTDKTFTNDNDLECYTFRKLLDEYVKMDSKYINMIISACRFKLLQEKKKVIGTSRLDVSVEEAINLERHKREIAEIRQKFEKDYPKEVLDAMPRLEVKQKYAELNKEILEKNMSDPVMYQLLRLSKLTTSTQCINPITRLKIERAAKRYGDVYSEFKYGKDAKLSKMDRLEVDQEIKRFRKVARRAELNRMLTIEVSKRKDDPANYTAPDFM